jgi:ParB family transcriptional regulator, chromosome partitioning protein
MSRRDRIKDLYALPTDNEKLAMANSTPPASDFPVQRQAAGPVRSMGLALDRIEQESRALHDALATGASIVELDPALIDPSFVRDRLPDSAVATFDSLKKSIAERGQEVPILVRPHPSDEGRYQVAFGHRRLRAISSLGLKVRAVVRALSDIELVTAQGVENSQREDLSYIERAVFAARLEDQGFARNVIIDALATDKTELSKLISVARAVPENVVYAIGPAPKAGRRRWQTFADLFQNANARRAAEQACKDPDLAQADTNTRFIRVLVAASQPRLQPTVTNWKGPLGLASAKVTRTAKAINLVFDIKDEPAFGEFVVSQLDQLYSAFQSQKKAAG